MKITRSQLRRIILELVEPEFSRREVSVGSHLPGGSIIKFTGEPTKTGRFNVGYDKPTMKHTKAFDPTSDAIQNTDWYGEHGGLDIFGHVGDAVGAYIDGYVHKAENEPGKGGNVVIIATSAPADREKMTYPSGTEFVRYAHLDSIDVSQGDIVSAGTTIGKLGCTGNCRTKSTHPHIHLTVSGLDRNGRYSYSRGNRDPFPLFNSSGWIRDEKDIAGVTTEMKITRRQLRRIIREELTKAAPFGSGMSKAKVDKHQKRVVGHT